MRRSIGCFEANYLLRRWLVGGGGGKAREMRKAVILGDGVGASVGASGSESDQGNIILASWLKSFDNGSSHNQKKRRERRKRLPRQDRTKVVHRKQ